MKKTSLLLAAAAVLAVPAAASAAPAAPDPADATVTGWSVLPTLAYVPGSESSGHWTTGNAQVPAPYPAQPVQGFSGTHRLADGTYYVLSDNGFGSKANSADFQLAVHHIAPDTTSEHTTYLGTVFNLSDPDHLVPWTIWRDGGCQAAASLPAGYTCPARDRILTGSDFDVESLQVAPDGTFWFGDEFGPYLLHTDAHGHLLQAPIPTPGVQSPSNPTLGGATPNLANSKGFEGMAISPNGEFLYPMLEGSTAEDTAAGHPEDRRIFRVHRGVFEPGNLRYRMEAPTNSLGDFILVNSHQGLIIERDDTQGATATFKRIYLVDLSDPDGDGYVEKTLLVDLLHVANPANHGGFGPVFRFPFFTIEDVEVVDDDTIAVMNDNNFPATGGRGPDVTDPNEYVEITLGAPLHVDRRLLAH